MDYINILFVRKDKYIKYLCAMILRKFVLDKIMFPINAIVMALIDTVEGKHH